MIDQASLQAFYLCVIFVLLVHTTYTIYRYNKLDDKFNKVKTEYSQYEKYIDTTIFRKDRGVKSNYFDDTFYYGSTSGTFVEGLGSSNSSHKLSAIEAQDLVDKAVSKEVVSELLKPIYTKIKKASEKGDSEIFVSGRDWYYCNNKKYQEAKDELTKMGYEVWRDNSGLGVIIKW